MNVPVADAPESVDVGPCVVVEDGGGGVDEEEDVMLDVEIEEEEEDDEVVSQSPGRHCEYQSFEYVQHVPETQVVGPSQVRPPPSIVSQETFKSTKGGLHWPHSICWAATMGNAAARTTGHRIITASFTRLASTAGGA